MEISPIIGRKLALSAAVALAAFLATPGPVASQAVTGQATPVVQAAPTALADTRIADGAEVSAVRAERAAVRAEGAADRVEAALQPRARCTLGGDNDRWARFENGLSYSRRCIVSQLRHQRRAGMIATAPPNPDLNWPDLVADSETLRDFYLARSDRSQAFQDGGATAAGVGGLGAALSTGTAAASPWGYLALAGVLTVNFTGSQPMRDLYYAGHLGVGYVEARYLVLMNRPIVLRRLTAAAPSDLTEVGKWLGVVEAWPDAADRAAFQPVLRQMYDISARVVEGESQIKDMTDNLAVAEDLWPAAFADDLLALDGKLDRVDVQLRPTPGAALSSAASVTLRALDSLISGQSSQEALNRVRINTLLDNMTVDLTPIRVGTAPSQIATRVVLSPELLARSSVTGRRGPTRQTVDRVPTDPCIRESTDIGPPTDACVGAVLLWVRTQLPVVETARRRYNERAVLAAEIQVAAARSVLRFDYNVDSGTASVGLGEPAAQAPVPAPEALSPPRAAEIVSPAAAR